MNIGATEILVILLVAFVIVGPKDLPKVARALGRFFRYIRGLIAEVKRETGLDSIETDIHDVDRQVKEIGRSVDIRKGLQKTQLDVGKELNNAKKELSFNDFQERLDDQNGKGGKNA